MKLIRAHFQNYRLLRDLELNFSTDAERKLTVIRAANETGKTTILNALQWALYGDDALPGKGADYRLHPIDWDVADGNRVPIIVTVEFEVVKYNRGFETRRSYRIVRTAYEEIQGQQWARSGHGVRLFALTETGAQPIDSPESFIREELPPELREVFFTDGDRALSFIEAEVALSTKRDRVQKAIRSLLGLGVIEEAIRHVGKAAAEVNKQAKRFGNGGELATIASRLEGIEAEISKLEAEHSDAKEQFAAFDEKVSEIDRKIDTALQRGDREKLGKELEGVRSEIKRLDERIVAANKEHSALFRSQALARDIVAPVLEKAFDRLRELHDHGKIPNATIPVLEERLSAKLCICGESLEDDGEEGSTRRDHIRHLIEESRRADEIQEIVTDLYYGSKPLQQARDEDEASWIAMYTEVVRNRDALQALRNAAGSKQRGLDIQIDSLGDTNVQGLRDTRKQYIAQRDRFWGKVCSTETQLAGIGEERTRLAQDRDRLLREQKKGARILSELEVTQDVIQVLQKSYDRITNEELAKVSQLMNAIFLEMIGADPEQGAIIQRAEISHEFDIIVYGPNDRTLNPDRDLNGASRRALTLAFILALTRVSEVEAPNVIDTPLGMMSGYVKRSVLKTAIRESSQLVLFLTHSEIAGCDEILDDAAGAIYTLTNTAHYPTMLVNDPGLTERRVLRCGCTHRHECQLCERRHDTDLVLEELE